MHALIDRVRQFVRRPRAGRRRHAVCSRRCRADRTRSRSRTSCASSTRAGELRLAGLAHFNHQLRARGRRRRAVRRAARGIARRAALRGPRATSRRARGASGARSKTPRAPRATRSSSGRARTSGADVVALGHTRDDQAETFLLRLLRGAGPRGLGGMHPRNGAVVRPLLDCRRDELRSCSRERELPFVDDETNADVSIPRNRVRAELLPLLEARFNPAIVDVLADEADAGARDVAMDGQRWPTRARHASCVRPARDSEPVRARSTIGDLRGRSAGAAPAVLLARDDGLAAAGGRFRFGHVAGRAPSDGSARRRPRSMLRASVWNASARGSS